MAIKTNSGKSDLGGVRDIALVVACIATGVGIGHMAGKSLEHTWPWVFCAVAGGAGAIGVFGIVCGVLTYRDISRKITKSLALALVIVFGTWGIVWGLPILASHMLQIFSGLIGLAVVFAIGTAILEYRVNSHIENIIGLRSFGGGATEGEKEGGTSAC